MGKKNPKNKKTNVTKQTKQANNRKHLKDHSCIHHEKNRCMWGILHNLKNPENITLKGNWDSDLEILKKCGILNSHYHEVFVFFR